MDEHKPQEPVQEKAPAKTPARRKSGRIRGWRASILACVICILVTALVTSLILCPVALIILCTYYKMVITWYNVFASFIAAFVVYLVATGGWEKVKSIWDRTKYKDSEGE